MAITVSGTTITFNDATTQTTAGGAVNTTTVLAATAGATVGAVGTYALMRHTGGSPNVNPGSTFAGSNLLYGAGVYIPCSGAQFVGITTPSGTWRAMGYGYRTCVSTGITVWLRIS